MTKQVDAPRIDRILRFKFFNEVAQEVGTILRRGPALRVVRVRSGHNNSFLLRVVFPFFDQSDAVSSRAVQRYDQRRLCWRRDSWGDVEIIGALLSARGDQLFGDLVFGDGVAKCGKQHEQYE